MKILAPIFVIFGIFAVTSCGPNAASLPGLSTADGETEYLAGYGPPGARTYNPNSRNALGNPTGANQPRREKGFWDDQGISGPPKIRLNIAEQRAYFYKGSQLVGVSPISTGKEGHNTPRGSYKVTEKDIDHTSSCYGQIRDKASNVVLNPDADNRRDRIPAGAYFENAPMPYFLRFNGGVGMHQGYLPGYAASHGCVRMPENMARQFFDAATVGTPVIVE